MTQTQAFVVEPLIEVKPLKPFCGSYRCALDDADVIDDEIVADDQGNLIKRRIARKKFVGLIPVERAPREIDFDRIAAGDPAYEVVAIDPKTKKAAAIVVHPSERTVFVPSGMAQSLVERGLAEAVAAKKGKR